MRDQPASHPHDTPELKIFGIMGMPAVEPGGDLAALLCAALEENDRPPAEGDVVVVAQKIVSKAEGRLVDLRAVVPSQKARSIARKTTKDPRLVELVLGESVRVLRAVPGVLITETRTGLVMANAGVDQSNLAENGDGEFALLLPENPDRSAAALCERIGRHFGVHVGVIISDSVGRAWREGTVGLAIGLAGLAPIRDFRELRDLFGRTLQVNQMAIADALASAANIVMGEAAEGRPAALIRGAGILPGEGGARALMRPRKRDLFR